MNDDDDDDDGAGKTQKISPLLSSHLLSKQKFSFHFIWLSSFVPLSVTVTVAAAVVVVFVNSNCLYRIGCHSLPYLLFVYTKNYRKQRKAHVSYERVDADTV